MTEKPAKMTPMFEQYLRIKEENPHALLFYRMGDFYELFFDDAVTAAHELQIALTSRSRDTESPIPMCGVPWHAVESYIAQLVDKGYHVAICDQVEDPKAAKGLVQRAVTRIITAGTVVEDANLSAKNHNYLGALYWDAAKGQGGFAWAEASTGEWSGLLSRKAPELWQWVRKLAPRELLIPDQLPSAEIRPLEGIQVVRVPSRSHFDAKRGTEHILSVQNVRDLGSLGLDRAPELALACGALLVYLEQTQKQSLHHLKPFRPLNLSRHLIIDEVTERNLEIFVRLNGRRGKGTLWHVLDETLTPMGGRLLEERLRHPWREAAPIAETQEIIRLLHGEDGGRQTLRAALNEVYDLERLSTRISLNRANPRDFIALRQSLAALPAVRQSLEELQRETAGKTPPRGLTRILESWDALAEYTALLAASLVDSPPNVITDGGLFKSGYNQELDALLDLVEHGEQKLQAMLEEERNVTGVAKLRLGSNRVFGYYFEISRSAQTGEIPEHFIRRQTLANAERFTTVRLKELEEKLLSASGRRQALEYRLFQELRDRINQSRPRVLYMAGLIAALDYWQSLAEVARRWNWIAPQLDPGQEIHILEGRHPVVEAVIGSADFVPNDLHMDADRRLCLITGPNMAGKSTVLRQTALICILAQIGSFVPAREARLGLVDRVFSRVGASDNLAQGQSTFMVEMMETARILRQVSRRSLVILDEIGRGTSTYDGLALAWAVVEELARRGHGGIRTLFATHYHELTALEGVVEGLFTMNIAIREWNGDILFLHRLVPGPSDRSYGIEVARLAGVPAPVVQRAREILSQLERPRAGAGQPSQTVAMTLPGIDLPEKQERSAPPLPVAAPVTEHPLVCLLRDLAPEKLTPLDALKLLAEWKILWGTPPPQEA